MPYPAGSVDQRKERKAREARERRERYLRALMAAEENEPGRNPLVKVVRNQRPPDRLTTYAESQLLPPGKPTNEKHIPVSGLAPSRPGTNFTFRPRAQIEETQQARHDKSPANAPPALAIEHAEVVKPKAVSETTDVSRIDRPCNSDRRLQNALERVSKLEADRAQLRREREIDQLLRASKTKTKFSQANDSSQGSQVHEQDPGRRSHSAKSATSRPETNLATIGAARPELRVELPLRKTQKKSGTVEDVTTIVASRPRPATAVTISSTSSRDTTPESTEALAYPPPQSMQPVLEATYPYYSPSVRHSREKGKKAVRNASEIAETPLPSPPEVRPQTPSSMDDGSSGASPRNSSQQRHVLLGNRSNDSRTPSRDVLENRARESSIPGMEALNIRDQSPLASTTSSDESVRNMSPIPAGEVDMDYEPSSSVSLPGQEESEASDIHYFGPDSPPVTPISSRNTSDLFSPSDQTVSHMSLLSSPGESNTSHQSRSDGTSTPTAGRLRSGGRPRFLDGYLHAILDHETRAGSDFLAKQGQVYQKVFRTFFDIKCSCPHVCEQDEHEQTHSLRERVIHLQRSLPSLSEVFGEKGSYDPRSSFHNWKKILSDQPPEPLSFQKSEALHARSSVTVSRLYDIDSVWFAPLTLGAIRAPNDFRLTFLPRFSLHISTDQVVQPHGLNLAKTRHVLLGSFQTGSVRFSVFVFFPSSASNPHFKTSASSNTLSHERLRDFYDEIIFPAIREAVKDPFRQDVPQSFDMVYAMSRSSQEKPAGGHLDADDDEVDRRSSYQLSYTISAKYLSRFWSLVEDRSNLLRIPTKRGENVAYFKSPRLLFQAHDLKNTFARPSLHETLSCFGTTVLAGLDPDRLDMRSCWIDVGARYYADGSGGRQREGTEPSTLLWKSQCNRRLHQSLANIAPNSALSATHFRSFLLRDTGNLMSKTVPGGVMDAGHPDCRQPGIIRAKAYNSNKRIFGLPIDRNYSLFSAPTLHLAALNQDMIQDLDSMSKRSTKQDRVFTSRHSRESVLRAWEANKRHVRAISGPETVINYGARKEVTFCLNTILKEWSDGNFEPERNPHTGPLSQVFPLGLVSGSDADDEHCPFWILPTKDVNDLIFTQAARLVVPIDHLFQEASMSSTDEAALCNTAESFVRRIFALYTAQLLCRLLVYTFSSEREYNFDRWIWYTTWKAEKSKGDFWQRRGLGLEEPIKTSGMLWIPQDLVDWRRGHLALATLIELHIPRSPLQTRLTSQKNIQGLNTTQLTVEYIIQEWVQEAGQAFEECRDKKGHELAERIARLCAEEIARAYNQHLLDKIQSYWDRARAKSGRKGLKNIPTTLSRLQQARESVVAERSRIVTAQTIREIYNEAWPVYAAATTDDSVDIRMPAELPCWMTTRRLLPPEDRWSDFVFRHLFCRSTKPKWNRIYFLQVFRTFKKYWNPIKGHAGRFDDRVKNIIGRSILVTFNSNQAKEVGTNHTIGTWYHRKPTFFQMQYWAPYFSPPEENRDLRLASMPSVHPTVMTAVPFQDLERAAHQNCLCIMDRTADLRKSGKDTVNSRCRRALRQMTVLAGPTWGSGEQLDHVQPWKLTYTDDAFRVPLWHGAVAKAGPESFLSEPTFLMPTRDMVMGLFKTIKSFPELTEGLKKRLRWARRRLHNDGMPYDMHSHLRAKEEAAMLTSQSPSLLRQFLAQTEPPEKRVLAEELHDVAETECQLSGSDEYDIEPELEPGSDSESAELSDELPGDVW